MPITRRRLITISAAFAMLPAPSRATTLGSRLWTGQALGARASIRIEHPDGEAIAARVEAKGINPQPKSGQQELLENVVNRYV